MLFKLPVGEYKLFHDEHTDMLTAPNGKTYSDPNPYVLEMDEEENRNYEPKENEPPHAQGEYGEFIEYTAHFPEETHDRLNDLTPCPRHVLIDKECRWNAEHPSGEPPSVKLVADLGIHEKCVAHYLELQQAVKQGMVIDKIHRRLRFRQEAFASSYVILNNNERKKATEEKDVFKKDFFKLMNNSCFGQLMMRETNFKQGEFVSGTTKFTRKNKEEGY